MEAINYAVISVILVGMMALCVYLYDQIGDLHRRLNKLENAIRTHMIKL